MTTLATLDKSNAAAVTGYLEQCRTWLATCVELTGPTEIAVAKAEIATAAEATRQLGLSKEIQDDAAEMVRRAEYALRKATKKAQEAGEVSDRSYGAMVRDNTLSPEDEKVSPKSFFKTQKEYEDANAMGELEESDFEDVLSEAKAEGNLSRANVARKARERRINPCCNAGPGHMPNCSKTAGKQRKAPRRPLIETSRHAGLELIAAVERVERIFADDRFAAEAEQVAPQLRNHLTNAIETCQGLLDRINE